jgi:hypothetical protein
VHSEADERKLKQRSGACKIGKLCARHGRARLEVEQPKLRTYRHVVLRHEVEFWNPCTAPLLGIVQHAAGFFAPTRGSSVGGVWKQGRQRGQLCIFGFQMYLELAQSFTDHHALLVRCGPGICADLAVALAKPFLLRPKGLDLPAQGGDFRVKLNDPWNRV